MRVGGVRVGGLRVLACGLVACGCLSTQRGSAAVGRALVLEDECHAFVIELVLLRAALRPGKQFEGQLLDQDVRRRTGGDGGSGAPCQ